MSDIETGQEAAPEVNETENQARAQGWVPKDEWQGEGKWRDAEAFLDRGELFQKIDAQRREVRELRKTQEAFNSHLKTVRDAEYKRALQTLRAEKKEALVDGDADAVIAADEKLIALNAEITRAAQTEKQVPQSTEAPAEFVAWQARNSWYNETNRAMKAFADVEGLKLANSGMNPSEVLKEIEAQVRREFPEKFTNPNRSKPGAVEGGTAKPAGGKGESYPLSDDERHVMNRLVKSGTLTKEDYIRDLKAAKGER